MEKQWLNYQHLYYFMTIAQEGGVARASTKLRLGQSTLSTQLGQFENQLGMTLFERRNKKLYLTEAGRIALQYAREIFKLGDEMMDALHDRRQMSRISVQIGALDSVPKSVVVDLVANAQTKHPCSISIVEGHAEELLRVLKAHQIDLALFSHQPPAADRTGILARLAGRMPVVILGKENFLGLVKNFPQSLDGQPFVMPGTQSKLRHDVDHFFKLRGIHVDIVLEAQDSSLLTLLAAEGTGLIAVGAEVAAELRKKHGLKTIGSLPEVHEEIWLIGSERRIENPVASMLFKDFQFSGAPNTV